jgi:CheY-like chemotaxis protein
VDDNEINRQTAQAIINDLVLECVTAENASDALSKLESYAKGGDFNDVGAVLMDCQMSVMDGLTATEQIRSHVAGALNARIMMSTIVLQPSISQPTKPCMMRYPNT